MILVIATHNAHKAQEIEAFFHDSDLKLTCKSLDDIGFGQNIVEDALSFDGNALKKAKLVAQHTHHWVLADDSGLCVDALDQKPGIYSARYAHEHATDQENVVKLLSDIETFPSKAHYHCSMVCMRHEDKVYTTRGAVNGHIISSPKGEGGFGYDPVFFLPNLGQTMAQLTFEDKTKLSHRTQALQDMAHLLKTHVL